MNGQQLLTLISSILGDITIDQVYGLQLINIARNYIEMRRPWQVLKKKDTTQTVTGSNTYTTPFTVPTNLRRFLKEGSIKLFDGNNNIQTLKEVPFEDALAFKDAFGNFYVDFGQSLFYITGIVPGTFSVYVYYIANLGDITATTSWQGFPSEYHPILAFEVAAMYRLGTDYDVINARNADDNAMRSDMIYKSMTKWDAELSLGSVENLDYGLGKYGGKIWGRDNQPWNY